MCVGVSAVGCPPPLPRGFIGFCRIFLFAWTLLCIVAVVLLLKHTLGAGKGSIGEGRVGRSKHYFSRIGLLQGPCGVGYSLHGRGRGSYNPIIHRIAEIRRLVGVYQPPPPSLRVERLNLRRTMVGHGDDILVAALLPGFCDLYGRSPGQTCLTVELPLGANALAPLFV